MLRLRDYQEKFVAAVRAAWEWFRVVLGVLPTGGGKTICFCAVMHEHNGASAAVVHRKEIVGQISLALAALEVKHRIIAPPQVVTRIRRKHLKKFGKSFVDPHARAGVVSVQTLTSKGSDKNRELQAWVRQVTLSVFDEGHHYVDKGQWAKAVHMFDMAKILMVTATPERADGLGLGADSDGFAETMVEGPSVQWLMDNGYLCTFSYKAPKTDLDTSGIPLTATGDFNSKAMRARVVDSHLVGDVVTHYRRFCPGKRAIVFATDVETAQEMAAAFRGSGIAAEALSGETDPAVRDKCLDAFEDNELQVLVNVDLFDEGFDVPEVEAVILARPTESLGKFLQMIGRALRAVYAKGFDLSTVAGRLAAIAASAKPKAMVIDAVRNWERHGMPNWPRQWSLDGRKGEGRGKTSDQMVPQRTCGECTQPYEKFYLSCPYCGAPAPEPAERSAPDKVDGDLVELDVEAWAALFRKMEAADMDDEAYARDQIARNIPPMGRSADMKRHRDAKYRRRVLKELVAWWIGCQPAGRDLREKHRRFNYRFGVDIGTAFTLNAKDTNALIQRIRERFAEDMR